MKTFTQMVGLPVAALLLLTGCENNGLQQGDPNYWTTSRGQFVAQVPAASGDRTIDMFFLDHQDGTATVTFDGANPLHWASPTTASVMDTVTYRDTVVIPETVVHNGKTLRVTAIGSEAFMGCRKLKKVVIPESVERIGEGAFCVCTSLTEMNIPSRVAELPSSVFGQCQALDSIVIPGNVKHIGRFAFYGCKKARFIILEEGVEHLGEMCFFDCNGSQLLDITIPSTVTQIDSLVFGGHDATTYSHILSYTVLATTPPTLGGPLYYRPATLDETPVVHVPAGSVEAYKDAAYWKDLIIRSIVEE